MIILVMILALMCFTIPQAVIPVASGVGEHGEAIEETYLGSNPSSALYESRDLRPVS